jgi:uncharacterized protein (DUF2267 family)
MSFLSAKNAKRFPNKGQFSHVMLATMQLAMTVSKSQKFANALPRSRIVAKYWRRSGQPYQCLASFEKMDATPF